MTTIETFLSSPAAQRASLALLHFLWEGAVGAAVLWMAMLWLRNRSAQVRYVAASVVRVAMAAAPVVTWFVLPQPTANAAPAAMPAALPSTPAKQPVVVIASPPRTLSAREPAFEHEYPLARQVPSETPSLVTATAEPAKPVPEPRWQDRLAEAIQPAMPWIIAVWLAGVMALSLWHVGGWLKVRQLRRSAQPMPADDVGQRWLAAAGKLAGRLGLARPARLLATAHLVGPVVVGLFRPVVLVPVCALTGLSSQQIEAIMAHELAHIRRHDYLVNLLQTLVETLLFYHPAVWWVSSRIRAERENCCDDMAIAACRDRAGYARALVALAEARNAAVSLAVGAGSGEQLLPRIRRIMGLAGGTRKSTILSAALAIALVAAVIIVPLACSMTQKDGMTLAKTPVTQPASQPAGEAEGIKAARLGVYVYRLNLRTSEVDKLKKSLAESPSALPRFDPDLMRNGLLSEVGRMDMDVQLQDGARQVAEKTFSVRRDMTSGTVGVATKGQLEVSLAGVRLNSDTPPAGHMTIEVAMSDLKDASTRATTLPAETVSPFRCKYDGPVVLGQPVHIFTEVGADKCVYLVWVRLRAPGKAATTRPSTRPATHPADVGQPWHRPGTSSMSSTTQATEGQSWGDVANGLRTRWVGPTGPITSGETPVLTIEVQNASDQPITWMNGPGTWSLIVDPVDANDPMRLTNKMPLEFRLVRYSVQMGPGVREATKDEASAATSMPAGRLSPAQPVQTRPAAASAQALAFYYLPPGASVLLKGQQVGLRPPLTGKHTFVSVIVFPGAIPRSLTFPLTLEFLGETPPAVAKPAVGKATTTRVTTQPATFAPATQSTAGALALPDVPNSENPPADNIWWVDKGTEPVIRTYEILDLLATRGGPMHFKAMTVWSEATSQPAANINRSQQQADNEKLANELIAIIQQQVAPKSWQDNGNSIRFLYGNLVVAQSPENHKAIAALLDELRRGDKHLLIDGRIVSIPAKQDAQLLQWMEAELKVKLDNKTQYAVIDDATVSSLLERILSDPDARTLTAPQLTVFDQQRADAAIGNQSTFLLPVLGQTDRVKMLGLLDGWVMGVIPTISKDGGSISVAIHPTTTRLISAKDVPQYYIASKEMTADLRDNQTLLLRIPMTQEKAIGVKPVEGRPGDTIKHEVVTEPQNKDAAPKEYVYVLVRASIMKAHASKDVTAAPVTNPASAPATKPAVMTPADVAMYHRQQTGEDLPLEALKKLYTYRAMRFALTAGDPHEKETQLLRALAFDQDELTLLQLHVYLGDAYQLQTKKYTPEIWRPQRLKAAEAYFAGLALCHDLPADPPEIPVITPRGFDTDSDALEQYRKQNEQEWAARGKLVRLGRLIQLRQVLTSQIVQMYAREPDDYDQLQQLAMKFLGNQEAAAQLVAAAKAYRANPKAAIPVLSFQATTQPATYATSAPATQAASLDRYITTRPAGMFQQRGRAELLAFSPDGKELAIDDVYEGIRVVEVPTGRLLRTLRTPGYSANSLMFSPDGSLLAAGTNGGDVRIWDARTLELRATVPVGRWSIYGLAMSPDGSTLAACDNASRVELWNYTTGQKLRVLDQKSENTVAMSFSPDGKVLVTAARDGNVEQWDVATGRQVGSLPGTDDFFMSICFSPNGKTVVIGRGSRLSVWNTAGEKASVVKIPDDINPMKRLTSMSGPIDVLVCPGRTIPAPSGTCAASVTEDGSIAIWDITTRTILRIFSTAKVEKMLGGGIDAVTFSADGKMLATGDRWGHVEIWALGEELGTAAAIRPAIRQTSPQATQPWPKVARVLPPATSPTSAPATRPGALAQSKWEADIANNYDACALLFRNEPTGNNVSEVVRWEVKALKDNPERIQDLQKLLKHYLDSPFADDAALLLARSQFLYKGDAKAAIDGLYDVIKKYPDGTWFAGDPCVLEDVAPLAGALKPYHDDAGNLRLKVMEDERKYEKGTGEARSEGSIAIECLDYEQTRPNKTADEAKYWIAWIIMQAKLEDRYPEAERLLRELGQQYPDGDRTKKDMAAGEKMGNYLITRIPRVEREASVLLVDLLERTGRKAEALAEVQQHLRLYAGSPSTDWAKKEAEKLIQPAHP